MSNYTSLNCNKHLFSDFDDALTEFNLVQIVKFETWSRMVGTERRSSILDHVYIKDPTLISQLNCINPFFADHVLVEFVINANKCHHPANFIIPVSYISTSII